MANITPDSRYNAGSLTVNVKKIPFGTVWNKDCPAEGFKKGDLYKADRLLSGGTGKVCGITVHNTPNTADAATYTLSTFNQNMNSARVHFYVDDKEAWQTLELCEVGWHAGTGAFGGGNEDTVAIEIIMGSEYNETDKIAEANGALLTAYLLRLFGLGIKDVYTHKHWNGKYCPAYILPHWEDFLALVEEKYRELEAASKSFEKGQTTENGGSAQNAVQEADNTPDAYAETAIKKACGKGILCGDASGNLRLHSPLLRQDLFVILERLCVI